MLDANLRAGLTDFLGYFEDQRCEGVEGVVRINSGKPGPVLGITACTHGNEPAGLVALRYLLEEREVAKGLLRGTLYLAVNNLAAAKRYLAARTDDEAKKLRFVDINMNRLPDDMPALVGDQLPYELKRAQALLPIWRRFTVGLDLHSTTQDVAPMIICKGSILHRDLVRGFPISRVLTNIDVVQIGQPVFGFCGSEGSVPVFEIEAGSHETPKAFQRAKLCVWCLLQNLGMVKGSAVRCIDEYEEYFIEASLMVPDTSYRLARVFADFEFVRKGTPLAVSGSREIRAPFDGHAIFGSQSIEQLDEKQIREELLFLSLPVRRLPA